jgi:hypothetical protein
MRAIPKNQKLYEEVKKEAKKKFKVWPSAYASGWLVKEYKRRSGTYVGGGGIEKSKSKVKSRGGGISRWYEEKWINVCELPAIVSCGRRHGSIEKYPYCRPSVRVSKKTPRTVMEISKKELKRRCSVKRKNPLRRVSGE